MDKTEDKTGNFHFRSSIITNYEDLKVIIEGERIKKKRIGLTNGAFDLLHHGHTLYIEKAREFCDFLVLGVDSDPLIQFIKGSNRPVAPLNERLTILSFLRPVDIITVNELPEEESEKHKGAKKLIHLIRPDVLIISKSTKERIDQEMAEYKDYCGKIVVLEPQATTSTTAKISKFMLEGTEGLISAIDKTAKEFLHNLKEGGVS